jgi:hypothetical protein
MQKLLNRLCLIPDAGLFFTGEDFDGVGTA